MTLEIALTLGVLVVAICLFVWDRLSVDVVATLALLALTLSGILTVPEALSGFSNAAVVTIGAIFVVSGAMHRTGLADRMGALLLRLGGRSEAQLLLVVMIGVCALSAFMYNAPATAVLLPAVVVGARRSGISPSRLLIPLSFGALLGGTITLLGAAPNLVVSQALEAAGRAPLRVFDLAPMGILVSLAGIAFMGLIGRRLLPDRDPVLTQARAERPEELVALYRLPERWHRLRIPNDSLLVGRSLADACLECDTGIILLAIERNGRVRSADSGRGDHIDRLRAGDVLLAQGHDHDVQAAAAAWGVEFLRERPPDWALGERALAEVTLAPRSELEGKTIGDLGFRQRFGAEVLGVWRGERAIRSHLADVALHIGDALLLQVEAADLDALRRDSDFIVLTGERATSRRNAKSWLAFAILAVNLGLVIAGVLPLAIGTLLAATLMVLTGCLLPQEVYRDVDWRVLIMLGGTIAIGQAMQKTGAALFVATSLIEPVAALGTVPLLAALFLAGSVLSITTSNVAAAVLLSPLVVNVADHLSYEPHALLITLLMGISTAFVTPFAHQAHLIVMGPGNYRFGDYFKVGALLSLLVFLVTMLTLPVFWPLR